MSAPRFLPNMDELLKRYSSLGDKKLPKSSATTKPKPQPRAGRKKLTPQEQILQTERAIENKVKDDDDQRVLAQVNLKFDEWPQEPPAIDVDPSTLCPLCDKPFPRHPSQRLCQMLHEVKLTSKSDPRPENSMGLLLPTLQRAPFCARHQFERDEIPKARYANWKTEIDLKDIERRLETFQTRFDALVNDCAPGGARELSLFWSKAMHSATESSLKSQGLAGNMATFKSGQVGYYGEQGLQVIDKVLRRIVAIPEGSTNPLTEQQFIAFVLTPEAAVCLISADLNSNRDDAVRTMYDSSTYGNQMFPVDD